MNNARGGNFPHASFYFWSRQQQMLCCVYVSRPHVYVNTLPCMCMNNIFMYVKETAYVCKYALCLRKQIPFVHINTMY